MARLTRIFDLPSSPPNSFAKKALCLSAASLLAGGVIGWIAGASVIAAAFGALGAVCVGGGLAYCSFSILKNPGLGSKKTNIIDFIYDSFRELSQNIPNMKLVLMIGFVGSVIGCVLGVDTGRYVEKNIKLLFVDRPQNPRPQQKLHYPSQMAAEPPNIIISPKHIAAATRRLRQQQRA